MKKTNEAKKMKNIDKKAVRKRIIARIVLAAIVLSTVLGSALTAFAKEVETEPVYVCSLYGKTVMSDPAPETVSPKSADKKQTGVYSGVTYKNGKKVLDSKSGVIKPNIKRDKTFDYKNGIITPKKTVNDDYKNGLIRIYDDTLHNRIKAEKLRTYVEL